MENFYSDDSEYLNNEEVQRKLKKFNKLQFTKDDVNVLKRLAMQKYGLINNSIRKKAWPLLILNKDKGLANLTDFAISKLAQYWAIF
jgi:hypothetical protein